MSSGKLEVLTVSMNNSIELYKELNLKCKSIISNQCDNVSFLNTELCQFISTNTKGVGKNRNIALIYATEDIILFGDDDMKYVDNLEELVINEFESNPKADVLIFNIETLNSAMQDRRQNTKNKKVGTLNFMNYGAVRIACRRKKIEKNNIWFSTEFGGGCMYGSGEDSIFLADCLKNKLRIYTSPICIGAVDQGTSSWFKGYNEKYFFDKGALLKKMFPLMSKIFIRYFSFKNRKKMGYSKIKKLMNEGARAYNRGTCYDK